MTRANYEIYDIIGSSEKLTVVIITCMVLFLSGCTRTTVTKPEVEIYIVSGTVIDISYTYSAYILIETEDGIKIPVYEEMHSNFSRGLKNGDKVSFKVEKVDGTGYRIIGLGFENDT